MSTIITPNSTMTQEQLKSMAGQVISTVDSDGLAIEYLVVLAAAAIANGDPLVWDPTSDTGYTVKINSAVGQRVVGVGVAAIASGEYGYVMKRGHHTALLTDDSVTAGGSITCDGAGLGKLADYASAQEGTMTAMGAYATALDNDAGSDPYTVEAMVNCPG